MLTTAPEPAQGYPKKFLLALTPDMHAAMKRLAAEGGRTTTAEIRRALKVWIDAADEPRGQR